jgi:hypothetical protein
MLRPHPCCQFTELRKDVGLDSEEAFKHLSRGQDSLNRTGFAAAIDAVFHALVGPLGVCTHANLTTPGHLTDADM